MMKHISYFLAIICLTSNSFGQTPDFVPEVGLIAWYDFSNNACDLSGQSGCFELFQGAYIDETEGSDDLALRLDGNYAQLPADPNFNLTEFTIAFRYLFDEGSRMRIWKGNLVYPDDVNYSISSNDEIGFVQNFTYSQNCSSILDNTPNWFSASALQSPGAWLDVVVTRSNAGVVSIITQNSTDIFTGTSSICNETQPIRIGHWWDGDPNPSYGWVDHIGFWSTVLSESEIAQLLQRQMISIGCMDASACNYNAENSWDDGSCEYGCLNCGPGTFWNDSLSLCMPSPSICNEGTYWDPDSQTCMPVTYCPEDLNFDGVIGVADLLQVLASFGFACVADDSNWQCGVPINYQGYDYTTVLIGEQCWFAENLRTEHYQNGDSIPWNLSSESWGNTSAGAYSTYGADGAVAYGSIDAASNSDLYGKLYNGFAVQDERGLCPTNWSIPTDDEWASLEYVLGMDSIQISGTYYRGSQAEKAKSNPNDIPPWNGSNLTGLSLIPGGYRNELSGVYFEEGLVGYYWCKEPLWEGENIPYRAVSDGNNGIYRWFRHPSAGFSVRCIQD